MDKPQAQIIPKRSSASYRYMSYPFPKQQLQLLYPGRIMESDYSFTADNIPNEDPKGAYETKMQTAELARIAKRESEAISRHLGGKYPVLDHASLAPETPVEDLADFTDVSSVGTRGKSDIAEYPSNLPPMTELHEKDIINSKAVLSQINKTPEVKKPLQYDWEKEMPGIDFVKKSGTENFEFDKNDKNVKSMVLSFLPFSLILLMFALILCYYFN